MPIRVAADDNKSDPELLSDATRDAVIDGRIGKADLGTVHRTIYRWLRRVVEKFNHGRVFLAVNAATYWHTLRASGIDDREPGFGSLLEAL